MIIQHTKQWIERVIVGENFCPFARKTLINEAIRYRLDSSDSLQQQLQVVIEECVYLTQHADIDTTLIIYPKQCTDFSDYLEFLDMAEQLLVDMGFEGIYQLASFHPDYCFADAEPDDATNYTNRSPYPMLHILREEMLEQVLAKYPNPESIPENNIRRAREIGVDNFRKLLAKLSG